jgi:hypothetical protein
VAYALGSSLVTFLPDGPNHTEVTESSGELVGDLEAGIAAWALPGSPIGSNPMNLKADACLAASEMGRLAIAGQYSGRSGIISTCKLAFVVKMEVLYTPSHCFLCKVWEGGLMINTGSRDKDILQKQIRVPNLRFNHNFLIIPANDIEAILK